MAAFYNHWALTLDDSLVVNAEDPTFKTGTLPDTVPDITGGYDSDASWSSVWPTTLNTLWTMYGDAAPVARFWPGVIAYVNATMAGIDAHGDVFHQFGVRRLLVCAHAARAAAFRRLPCPRARVRWIVDTFPTHLLLHPLPLCRTGAHRPRRWVGGKARSPQPPSPRRRRSSTT